MNDDCEVATVAETFNGFLNAYSRMTERCCGFYLYVSSRNQL